MSDRQINLLITSILAVTILIYVFSFASIGGGNEIKPLLKQVQKSAQEERWEEAQTYYDKLMDLWMNKTAYFVALNFAEEDFSTFEEILNRVNSALKYKDAQKANEEIEVLLNQWKNFNKIVPKP